MDISFIIPLYNCLPLTQAMLRSLYATIPADLAFEIIFVDDGSTDGTRDWLRSIESPTVRGIYNEANLGYAAANNRGAALSRGRILALLNNDLELRPRWLEPILGVHAKFPNAGAVGNVQRSIASGEIDHAGIRINAKGKPEHLRATPGWIEHTREVVATTGACLTISRALWNEVGGFDDGFLNGCEDVDLCLRLRSRRRTTYVSLNSIIGHHVSASPGRKRRDEANTRRLTLRWRDELALLGARAWCEDFVSKRLNAATAFGDPAGCAEILAHALGLSENPPIPAVEGMQAAIETELSRWRELLGPPEISR